MIAVLSSLLTACLADDGPVGMSLLFQSAGHPVGVARFDPDGQRGPIPGGVVGMFPHGGAHMNFMQGDSKRPVPSFVDIEWTVESDELRAEMDRVLYSRADKFSDAWMKDFNEFMKTKVPRYTRRIDLTPIITPELLAKVRADRRNSLLKLIITFNNDQVDIKAEVEKWR
jgi:hypothetical protein